MSEVEKLIPTKRIAESILRISNGEVSTNLIEQLATDYLAADKEIATKDELIEILKNEPTLEFLETKAELARLREALSEAKRNLTRGIIIPKDIADSIDDALNHMTVNDSKDSE